MARTKNDPQFRYFTRDDFTLEEQESLQLKYSQLGLAESHLLEHYIHKNKSLTTLSSELHVDVSVIRRALSFFKIKKDRSLWFEHPREVMRQAANDPESRLRKGNTGRSDELKAQSQAKSSETRRRKRLNDLAARGITKEFLRELYVAQNKSLAELSEILLESKTQIRSWIGFFGLRKSPELRREAQLRNLQKLYEDPARVDSLVEKAQDTIAHRYGHSWYRNATSKEETELVDSLQSLFPQLQLRRGDYSVIRRPGRGGALQLDVYFPELALAIEYNGEYWHDRAAYEADLIQGTTISRERLKDRLCEALGIKLIHVWSGDWKLSRRQVLEELMEAVTAASFAAGLIS